MFLRAFARSAVRRAASEPCARARVPQWAAQRRALSDQPDVSKMVSGVIDKKDDGAADDKPAEPAEPAEAVEGETVSHKFEAETKQLLEIVAKSLYTDKEVFIRELVSNASDALEKRRHAMLLSASASDAQPDAPLEVKVTCDSEKRLLVIQDSGVGMTKEDLVENLGCIARSGSQAFLNELKGDDSAETVNEAASSIIGRFGVGFYSVFMVADSVRVFSRHSGSEDAEGAGWCWTSTGDGSYSLAKASNVRTGTKIEITLKEGAAEFASRYNLERIIRKHSSFVTYPVLLHGERINNVEPVWMKAKKDVSTEEHEELYRHLSHAYDSPMYTLQFQTDAPIAIKSVFYVPQQHKEKMGMGQQEPCVSLYSRKVLITANSAHILPQWMRFIVGVVDSEDIPLNISRESMQDSALLRRMNGVLSSRLLKWFAEEGKKDPGGYLAFYSEFQRFFKEGVCTDFMHQKEIMQLLRFETSTLDAGEVTSLDDYISRMPPEQGDKVYYLVTSSRAAAESSAYMEVFRKRKMEVLYCFQEIDDFVMQNAGQYEGKILTSATNADLTLPDEDKAPALPAEEADALAKWMADEALAGKVSGVAMSSRLVDSPAVINEEGMSASMRRFMSMVNQAERPEMPKQKLELNPSHPVIKKLAHMRTADAELATLVAQQLFDNALIGAGMLDDARPMLGRLTQLLDRSLGAAPADSADGAASADTSAAK